MRRTVYLLYAAFTVALVVSAVYFSGCGGENTPATPQSYGELQFSIDLSHVTGKMVGGKYLLPTISNVVASVSAADLDAQNKNLTNSGGVWAGTLQVRVGKNRTVTVEAIDPNSVAVYRNCQTITMDVAEGTQSVSTNLCDVLGNVVVSGKTIVNLVGSVSSSCRWGNIGVVTADSTNIYFADAWVDSSGTNCQDILKKTPISGGPVTQLASVVTSLSGGIIDLKTDGTEVFWVKDPSGIPGSLQKVSVTGGAVTTLASPVFPKSLALDGSNVYWVACVSAPNGVIDKIAKTGGAVTALASGLNFPQYVATDGVDVFWNELSTISKVSVSGGAVTTLINTGTTARKYLQLSGANIYYCTGSTGAYSIMSLPKTGGAETALATGIQECGGLFPDATDLYFFDYGTSPNYSDGVLKKVPLGGGAVTTIASPLNRPNDPHFFVDATNIYWLDTGTSAGGWTDGVIRKMQK